MSQKRFKLASRTRTNKISDFVITEQHSQINTITEKEAPPIGMKVNM